MSAASTALPPYLSLSQVGRLLQVSFRRVKSMRDAGQLPAPVQMGKHPVYPTRPILQMFPEVAPATGTRSGLGS
jgi:hypothetical protein